jgi:hypothetical protein
MACVNTAVLADSVTTGGVVRKPCSVTLKFLMETLDSPASAVGHVPTAASTIAMATNFI